MRGLSARRIASCALTVAFLAGVSGPAAMAADSAREHSHAASPRAPLPGADRLLAQVHSLRDPDGRLAPVTDLLMAVLRSDHGKLSAADAKRLGDAAKRALGEATAPAAPTASATPTATAKPTASASPAAPAPAPTASGVLLPAPAKHAAGSRAVGQRAADPTSDALAAVQKALDNLLKTVASGDVSQVLPAVTGLVNELIGLVTATLSGNGLSTSTAATTATASTLPALTVPEVTVPEITVPDVTVPDVTIPDITLPTAAATVTATTTTTTTSTTSTTPAT